MVVDTSRSLDEIMALLQLGTATCLTFYCQNCGGLHHLRARSWYRCRYTNVSYSSMDVCDGTVRILPEQYCNNQTTVTLPGLNVVYPPLHLHKLVFYSQEKALQLLKQYAAVVRQYYDAADCRTITLFDRPVPLTLILRRDQYKQLIYQLMQDSTSYQQYVSMLRQSTAAAAQFICEHLDLFVPWTPEKVCIEPIDPLARHYRVSTAHNTLDTRQLQSALPVSLDTLFSALSFPIHHTTIHNWIARSCSTYGLMAARITFTFSPDTEGQPDTSDPVTAYLVDLSNQLYELVTPAVQALMDYTVSTMRR